MKHYIDIDYVKSLMREIGMSVGELAEKMGYSKRSVKKYLDGADQSHLRLNFPRRMAFALGVPIHYLFNNNPQC